MLMTTKVEMYIVQISLGYSESIWNENTPPILYVIKKKQ